MGRNSIPNSGDRGLDRFVDAQRDVWGAALAELHAGAKRSHWMWFVFPQVAGLGLSTMSRYYAIADLAEARAYLAHPLLGPRLVEATRAVLGWAGERDLEAMLGPIDAMKFTSSMTLFEAAGGAPCFAAALVAFCGGRRDGMTLRLVG